jgi:hypothetical protein
MKAGIAPCFAKAGPYCPVLQAAAFDSANKDSFWTSRASLATLSASRPTRPDCMKAPMHGGLAAMLEAHQAVSLRIPVDEKVTNKQ